MSYVVVVEDDHVYVKYSGSIDGLDIVRMAANEDFVDHVRRLQKVVHDFSFCDEVSVGLEDMREVAVLGNVESNFVEKLRAVVIPKSANGFERVSALSAGIRSPDWTLMVAKNYAEALAKIRIKD